MNLESRIKGIGAGLIASGALGLVWLGLTVLSLVLGKEDMNREFLRDLPPEIDRELAEHFMHVFNVAGLILNLIVSPLTILAGVQLLRGRSRNLGLVACVCALNPLPCWGCCCFAPIVGIFGLITLLSPEAKAWFERAPTPV